MKVADLDNPVRASWLTEQGYRLDPGPYVSKAYAARKFLARMRSTETLQQVTRRIFHPGRFRRLWAIDSAHGVPFLGSADIFQADLSKLPMITRRSFLADPTLSLESGWTLITCSGATSGRVTYARLSMQDHACSQDVIRVVPDTAKIPAGYLYIFLASPYGIPIIKGGVYGTSVKHIEPYHIEDLPVPRVAADVEKQIDDLITEAMDLRQRFEDGISLATKDLFESAGLADLLDYRWNGEARDIDFSVSGANLPTLRALNYSPRAQCLIERLAAVPHRTLGDICAAGSLSRGNRFKRIDSDPDHGVKLIGQRQGFWLRPEGRWITLQADELHSVHVPEETVMIAARGTLGENEAYCRALFVTGAWLQHGYSEDFLRVVSGEPSIPGAYLFAFLRSDIAFRVLRSMSTGGKQQDIHEGIRRRLPVPICAATDRERIAETVRQAYRDRDEADKREDDAFVLLDRALREAVS